MASFTQHVESVDIHAHLIVVGLSALEGDTWDGGIQTLSAETGELKSRVMCDAGVSMVRFTGSDGALVAAACDDGAIRLFASRDLSERATVVHAHDDLVSAVKPWSLSAGNDMLLSSGWDGAVKVWDINHLSASNSSSNSNDSTKYNNATEKDISVYSVANAHYGMIHDIATSPFQPALFASVGADGFFRLWDKRNAPAHGPVMLFAHEQAVSCLEFNPMVENVIYTGTDAGELYTLDLRQFKSKETVDNRSCIHEGRVRRICSIPSHREYVLTASDDMTIAISSIALTGDNEVDRVSRRVDERFQEHDDYVTDVAVYLSDSEGLTFLSGSTDKTVKLSDYKWKP